MTDTHENEEVDPVVLQTLLVRHRSHLANTHKELQSLKAFIKTLETTNEGLRHELNSVKLELSHFKDNEVRLLGQLESSEMTVERLTTTIHRLNQDHAATIAELESQRRQLLVDHKVQFDRVCAQLEATQQPESVAQPLPWKRISVISEHPVHILREVILEDQKREERILQRNLPITVGDNSFSATDVLSRLLSAEGDGASHDSATWWVALKRVHQVLKDRRLLLGMSATDLSADFYIRSRNAFVGEWAQLHREIVRGIKVISSLKQSITVDSGQAGNLFIERQSDLISSILSDIDTQCHRVKQSCFTDIDRVLYNLEPKRPKLGL